MVDLQRVEIVFGNVLKIMEVAEEPIARGQQLLTVSFDEFTITAEGSHVMYNLPIDHTVKMQVSYVDSAGNPAKVDSVEWFTANAEIAAIEVDPSDGTICKVIPVALGRTQVSAKADADLGEGVRELLTVCDIMIVAGEAVAGSIQPVGEQEPISGGGEGSGGGDHADNTLPQGEQHGRQ
ncbi:hypothetical protein [Bradyrhizobium cytisi]|uniref:Uncharacterized protein n=1 Tax=Bradyrhizobium cytisi TaxID=515489 RepID=A0A5S4X2Y5_9BRAD|nr:hypothetical protein [Bradyrhizobium cytisi]TYL87446.1 hypothetical protein FXB38_04830 [Bradyrhizobium cytisi]